MTFEDFEGTRDRENEVDDRLDALETLDPGALFTKRTVVAATPYTVVDNDRTIEVDTSGGARTVNLPAVASTQPGRFLTVKDSTGNAATNNLTVDGSGAETIDGDATLVIAGAWGSVTLWSDGTEWLTRKPQGVVAIPIPNGLLFSGTVGAAVRSAGGGLQDFWAFDDTLVEDVLGSTIIPPGVTTVRVQAYWNMTSAVAGDVMIQAQDRITAVGEDITAGFVDLGPRTVAVGGTAGIVHRTEWFSDRAVVEGDRYWIRFIRVASNAADTATGDLELVGLRLQPQP